MWKWHFVPLTLSGIQVVDTQPQSLVTDLDRYPRGQLTVEFLQLQVHSNLSQHSVFLTVSSRWGGQEGLWTKLQASLLHASKKRYVPCQAHSISECCKWTRRFSGSKALIATATYYKSTWRLRSNADINDPGQSLCYRFRESSYPAKNILVSYTIRKIYKISIRVRAHMSKSKVFLFSLIQKCTWKVPTIPFFQVCEIITCPLAPKLNLSEGKNNV